MYASISKCQMLFCWINICVWTKSIQIKVRAVITVLLVFFCFVGQWTQPAVTKADCCFLPSPSLRWNSFWPGDFSRSPRTLLGIWVSFFFFSLQPPPLLLVYTYLIFFFHSCDLRHYALCISGCPIFMNATFHRRMVGISLYLPQMSLRTQGWTD